MNAEKLQILEAIRAFEEMRYGPRKIPCSRVADLVSRVLGFDIQAGYFVSCNGKRFHVWNYDSSEREKVDLSADQFRGINETIKIIPANSEMAEMYTGINFAFLFNRAYSLTLDRIFLDRDYRDFHRYQKTGITIPHLLGFLQFVHEVSGR